MALLCLSKQRHRFKTSLWPHGGLCSALALYQGELKSKVAASEPTPREMKTWLWACLCLPGVCSCLAVPGSALPHTCSKSIMLCSRHHLFWVIVGLLRMTMRLWGWQPHHGWRVKLYLRANTFGTAPRGTGGPCHPGHFIRNCSYRIPAGPKHAQCAC